MINMVAGVQECVVCETEKGPAAAVVLRPGFSSDVKIKIHEAINSEDLFRGFILRMCLLNTWEY